MKQIDPADAHPELHKQVLALAGDNPYIATHIPRYMHSLRHMPNLRALSKKPKVLEIGTSFVFPPVLLDHYGADMVDVTSFDLNSPDVARSIAIPRDWKGRSLNAFNIDMESVPIPVESGFYDLVICFEVIEHLERDPMFMVAEMNRVLRPGGLLYLSTPNSTSARNVEKILKGYAPHFHMKYSRDRSLYRHNIEYGPGQLLAMMQGGGFTNLKFWTANNFEEEMESIEHFLRRNKFPTEYRGDNMLYIGERSHSVIERYPVQVYE